MNLLLLINAFSKKRKEKDKGFVYPMFELKFKTSHRQIKQLQSWLPYESKSTDTYMISFYYFLAFH